MKPKNHYPGIIMRVSVLIFAIVIAGLAASCRLLPSDILPSPPRSGVPVKQTVAVAPPAEPDSAAHLMIELTSLLLADPVDPLLLEKFDALAFDSASGSYLAVGRGLPSPNAPGEDVKMASRARAARITAQLGAITAKRRHQGSALPFNMRTSGQVAYMNVVCEEMHGDTLVQVFRVPDGSIIIR